ncbi:MAG: hypothetical protein KDB44_03390 [Mycobacterium sp.]|nr:hypothetical protein [Mycobacterium sp.]
MSRFTDDLDLVAREDYVPTTVNALLKRAGLTGAPRAKQAEAIRAWLETHHPSPMMEFSIRSRSFAELLDKRASA